MNINCNKIIENLDNSEDDYRGYIPKHYDIASHPTDFCEMLIGGRNIVNTGIFSKSLISGIMFKMIIQS